MIYNFLLQTCVKKRNKISNCLNPKATPSIWTMSLSEISYFHLLQIDLIKVFISTFQQSIDMKTCSCSMEMHLSHSDNCVSCNTSCINLKFVEMQLVFRQTVCRLQGRPPHNFNCPTRQGCLISPADKRL